MKNYSDRQHVNVGCGEDVAIRELAGLICDVVGFEGSIVADGDKPDGTPRKLLSVAKMQAMGWTPKTALRAGIAQTYAWYLENHE